MYDRRKFLMLCGGLGAAAFSAPVVATAQRAEVVTLLHTNDTHSRIDPFEGGRFHGMGGIAERASLIASLRAKNPATLVVDAGDIFQGTPYFNLFRGRVELETMSRAGYDIATLGNHDFDLGAEWLLTALERYASFAMCSSNLAFSHPSAGKLIKPYLLREVGGRRLGFFGLTIQLQGLVPAELWKGVRYLEPIRVAQQMVKLLREKHHCDAVILLSHLGYTGFQQEPGDIDLAKAVKGIDLIVGGHTHTFLDKPHWVRHADGTETAIVQVGHSGIYLGQVDLHFSERRPVRIEQRALPVGKPPTER